MDAVWALLSYLFSPRIFVIHLVALGLLYSLFRQRAEFKHLAYLALCQEIAILVLTSLLPLGAAGTILSIWICLYTYENAIGVRLEVHENVSFSSDFQFLESDEESISHLLEYTTDETGKTSVHTGLRCVTVLKKQPAVSTDSVVQLDAISGVDVNFEDAKLKKSLLRMGFETDCCIPITVSSEDNQTQSVILVAGSPELRDRWLTVLKDMVGVATDSISTEWLKQLIYSSADDDDDGDDPLLEEYGIEDAIRIISKTNRTVDTYYMLHMFENSSSSAGKGNLMKQGFDMVSGFTLSKIGSDKGKSSKVESKTKLSFPQLAEFFRQIVITTSVEIIFKRLQGKRSKADCLPPNRFHGFIVHDQKEDVTKDETRKWISKFEPVLKYLNFSIAGLSNYLLADEHSIFNHEHMQVYQDMDQPLSHYFLATSHNTYLTKDQLKSKSSVDAYISVLKRGCKCVELDCWDGPDNEPIIYHGHTLTSKVLFKDVIKSINEYAFCQSQYPVILSFENHCSVEQQIVMAKHLTTILGDKLFTKLPIPDDEFQLPSPTKLSGYVIVKAKKLKPGVDETEEEDDDFSDDDLEFDENEFLDNLDKQKDFDKSDIVSLASGMDEDELPSPEVIKEQKKMKLKSLLQGVKTLRGQKVKEKKVSKLAQELSDLVVYCQASSFKGFENSKLYSKHYEMSSFGEKKATKFSKDECHSFLEYNQRQLSRIYPAGIRIDSSNYNPVQFWNVGCQLVALNYQTACKEMQLNQGLFRNNGGCGYVLKPTFMRQERINFDPRGPFTKNQTLSIRIISGHQLPYKNNRSVKLERNYQVQVRMYGVEEDNQFLQTNPAKNNGYNPTWDEVLILKVHVPELAFLSFTVCSGAFVAQYSLPFLSMNHGFRRIPLLNKHSEPLPNAYLLARIELS